MYFIVAIAISYWLSHKAIMPRHTFYVSLLVGAVVLVICAVTGGAIPAKASAMGSVAGLLAPLAIVAFAAGRVRTHPAPRTT
jgi:tellurite resistance protein TehA-like permease